MQFNEHRQLSYITKIYIQFCVREQSSSSNEVPIRVDSEVDVGADAVTARASGRRLGSSEGAPGTITTNIPSLW